MLKRYGAQRHWTCVAYMSHCKSSSLLSSPRIWSSGLDDGEAEEDGEDDDERRAVVVGVIPTLLSPPLPPLPCTIRAFLISISSWVRGLG